MAPRPPVAIAVGVAVCAALAGCAGSDAPAPDATPTQYISAVERLLDPPAQLASSISERGSGATTPTPPRRRLDRIVAGARDRLAEFRALKLGDATLRRQRDRLAGAYARMIPQMRTAADALADGDRGAGLTTAASPFLDALHALPSAATSPSR
jgi:hypothetical protein